MGAGASAGPAEQSTKETAEVRSRRWMVAVDGSNASLEAFKSMMNIKKAGDRVTIFNAYSCANLSEEAKASEPWKTSILSKFEPVLSFSVSENLYNFVFEDLNGRTLRETLVDMLYKFNNDPTLASKKPDYLVFGYSGNNFTANSTDARKIGSVADLAMRTVHLPSIIVKSECPETAKSYVMAVDSSDLAKKGFNVLLRMLKPDDNLICLHVVKKPQTVEAVIATVPAATSEDKPRRSSRISFIDPDPSTLHSHTKIHEDYAREYYEAVIKTQRPNNSQFLILETENLPNSISDAIVNYINTNSVDFVALAPRSSQELGSVTEHVVGNVNSNIILCKS